MKEEKLLGSVKGGEAITLVTVCAVLMVSILAVIAWKIFTSSKGNVSIPGGYKFEWQTTSKSLGSFLKV